jgi:hypothetical protein
MLFKKKKKKKKLACNKLSHTVEQLQEYVRKQAEIDDTARQEAIVEVINKFELANALKQQLRTQYSECNHISDDRKFVINQFLYDEFCKEYAVVEKLRGCVSQIHAQKSNKIRWSYEENVEAAMVEQQQKGASSSSAPRVFTHKTYAHMCTNVNCYCVRT